MIYRIDVRTTPAARGGEAAVDPVGVAVGHQIAEFSPGIGPISTRRIFLIDTDADRAQVDRIARELLADPVVEQAEVIGTATADADGHSRIEIHLKPGVMDPVAASTEMAVRDMGLPVREVRTGRAYLIEGRVGRDELQRIAARVLANGVIESVHFDPFVPDRFQTGRDDPFQLRHVPLRDLTDAQLTKLSREGHLFLSLAEMRAAQSYFRERGREPTDVELETLAQTWSEHCVHKTLKSAVDVEVRGADGQTVATRHYGNLIRDTIFASTMELMGKGREGNSPAPSADFCLSVFKDNAGVVAFDETDAVCFKVETHNHPSAIEPYGGSATGAGGVIRDILGTGLAAKPVANTDVFCVAYPDHGNDVGKEEHYDTIKSQAEEALRTELPATAQDRIVVTVNRDNGTISATRNGEPIPGPLPGRIAARLVRDAMQRLIRPIPKGVIHPKRVLQQVVAGVRDYGNRMGIPTVNGAVYFDDRYLGNPLVFCGCVGILPRNKIEKETGDGDAVVVMGGRTGRDGIHGATFSSAELTDTHADEFSHAVQIGNAITEKKVADVILAARDRGLFTAVTDCGAGGLSSAVGEMGEKVGAIVDLDKVPLKYAGLRYDEIWISEAQERMVLSVPADKLAELLALSVGEDVEATVIGTFGTPGQELVLNYRGTEVGRMAMDFLHHGIPMPRRKAVVTEAPEAKITLPRPRDWAKLAVAEAKDRLLKLLAHPNIASKHWIVRQYDHEVQGGSVIKPLTGPRQVGPSDAAVLRPKLASRRGVAVGCGLAPHVRDPYEMAVWAIDEAVRNVVAVGADPAKIAILDNFCWPSVDDEATMGDLVRTCEACRDAALAYRIPFISGKDSLHNQFTDTETGKVLRIPNTLLISAIAVLDDVRRCVTMDLKAADNSLFLLGPADPDAAAADPLAHLPPVHRALAAAVGRGLVASCHDVSDGGPLVAAAEMSIASGLGAVVPVAGETDAANLFRERPGYYLVEVAQDKFAEALTFFGDQAVAFKPFGQVIAEPRFVLSEVTRIAHDISIDELTAAWRGTLDW